MEKNTTISSHITVYTSERQNRYDINNFDELNMKNINEKWKVISTYSDHFLFKM